MLFFDRSLYSWLLLLVFVSQAFVGESTFLLRTYWASETFSSSLINDDSDSLRGLPVVFSDRGIVSRVLAYHSWGVTKEGRVSRLQLAWQDSLVLVEDVYSTKSRWEREKEVMSQCVACSIVSGGLSLPYRIEWLVFIFVWTKGNVQRTRRVISDDIIVRGSDARDDKREDDMKNDDKGERDIRQGLDIL